MVSDAVPYPLLKQSLDRSLAACLLVVTLPVSLAAIAAIVGDMLVCRRDRGPLIYRERRISRGREFDLFKFRTLRTDAIATQAGSEPHARALEADPANLSWAGRHVLKPWYLDELPQLLNILRGELSLVGPRPWPPSMVRAQAAEGLDYRNLVMAGWTGPAQIHKDLTEPHAAVPLDLAYVDACRTSSRALLVRHDLGILWETLKVLARGEGLRY